MLFKLSVKNITKSIKDYAIYFFTLILGIAIFYVFNAIDSQTVMLNVSSSTYEIIKLMTNVLSGVSVFVSFILGFLIIYASRFLMKRRNKEFGIYLTLGMSKRKISLILFIETLLIGIVSLVVGLGLGIILSQFMSVLVANMFEADLTNFQFIFSKAAFIKSIIYFGIMYVIVMLLSTYNVSKCRLIDLIHANKKTEQIKLKNPWLCTIVFIIAAAVLGIAYYLVTDGFYELDTADKIFIPIIMGAVSTFFIFWSLSGLILKIVMSIKKLYYKGLNSFILRQLSSKINTTVFSMTIICLMLFVTICVLSSALSIKNSMMANLNELAPVDLMITQKANLDSSYLEKGYTQEQLDNSTLDILTNLKKLDVDIESDLKDITDINIYKTSNLTLKDTLSNSLEQIQKNYRFLGYSTKEAIVKLSDYNKVAALYGKDTYELEKNEYIIIADFDSMVTIRDTALKNKERIELFGHTLIPKYEECQNGFIEISSNHVNSGIIVVDDSIIDETALDSKMLLANYKAASKEEKLNIEKKLYNLKTSSTYINPDISSKLIIAEASMGLGGMVTFIGLYLGIVFLISSAAILALKELSESTDNRERYRVLRKIGVDERLINRALFRQIGIFFLFPLLIAIIHSIFGIRFSTIILETFGNKELLPSIIMTAVFLILIYGGYFLITYICSKNIIKER